MNDKRHKLTISMLHNMQRCFWTRFRRASFINCFDSELHGRIFCQFINFSIAFISVRFENFFPVRAQFVFHLNDVVCDRSSTIIGWRRPLQVNRGIVIICYLWFTRFIRFIWKYNNTESRFNVTIIKNKCRRESGSKPHTLPLIGKIKGNEIKSTII